MQILSTFVAVVFASSLASADAATSVPPDALRLEAQEADVRAEQAMAANAAERATKWSDSEAKHLAKRDNALKEANQAITALTGAEPSLSRLLGEAAGYAIYAKVLKGGAGIGAARGLGVLFERGNATGTTVLSQVTVGAQLGGQVYSEVVLFGSQQALTRFKRGQFALSAQASAVAGRANASGNAQYQRGVVVRTMSNRGLMAEASVGGQKFSYEPFAERT